MWPSNKQSISKYPLAGWGQMLKTRQKKISQYGSFSTVCSSFWVISITFARILFLYFLREASSLLYIVCSKIVSELSKVFQRAAPEFSSFNNEEHLYISYAEYIAHWQIWPLYNAFCQWLHIFADSRTAPWKLWKYNLNYKVLMC